MTVACPALTASIDSAQFETLKSTLLNKNGSISLHHRFRALFTLKALGDNRSVEAIAAGIIVKPL